VFVKSRDKSKLWFSGGFRCERVWQLLLRCKMFLAIKDTTEATQ